MTFTTTRLIFDAKLTGVVSPLTQGGKYDSSYIEFSLPFKELEKAEACHAAAIVKGEKVLGKRFERALPKWQEDGTVKYGYNGEKSPPMFPWVDCDGAPIALDTPIERSTKVRLIVDLKEYVYGQKAGLSFKIQGAMILELVTESGASDVGLYDAAEVADIFGKVQGFSQAEPAVRNPKTDTDASAYTDASDDLPF